MNLRYYVIPGLLLLLSSGCTHFSKDHSGLPESNLQKETASSSYPDESSAANLHNGKMIERRGTDASNPSASGEVEADSVVDGEKAGSGLGTRSNGMGLDPVSTQGIQTPLDEALELCEESQEYWQQGELENAVEALDRAYALILRR